MIVGRLLHFFFFPSSPSYSYPSELAENPPRGTKTAKTARLAGVSARRFGLLFVLLDIVAFIVQASGAVMLSGNDVSQHTIESASTSTWAASGCSSSSSCASWH